MTVLVSDSFNRANSTTTLGTTDSYNGGTAKTWSSATTYGISSNQAQKQTGSATNNSSAWVDGGVSDGKATITFTTLGNHCRLMFRRTDDNNSFWVYANGTTNYQLIKRQSSSNTVLATISVVPTNGDLISATFNGSSITVQINGANDTTVTNTFNQTATQVGFITDDSIARLDNFMLEDLTTGGTGITSTVQSNSTNIQSKLSVSKPISGLTVTSNSSATAILKNAISLSTNVKSNTSQTGNLSVSGTTPVPIASTVKSNSNVSLVSSAVTRRFTSTVKSNSHVTGTLRNSIQTISTVKSSSGSLAYVTITAPNFQVYLRGLHRSNSFAKPLPVTVMRKISAFNRSVSKSTATLLKLQVVDNMIEIIRFKRGNKANLPSLQLGEPAITQDTNELYVGMTSGNVKIPTQSDLDSVNTSLADKTQLLRNIYIDVTDKQFGAKGDGITDSTTGIQSAYNYAVSLQTAYPNLSDGEYSSTFGVILYFPPGDYIYNGASFTALTKIKIKGAGKGSTRIRLNASNFFLEPSVLYGLELEGITFSGGKGVLHHTTTGSSDYGDYSVKACEFYNYSVCAIGSNSSDMPYWTIKNNRFFGTNSSIGVALPQVSCESIIEENEFFVNKIHVKVKKPNGGLIAKNDFLRWQGGLNCTDIWLVPTTDDGNGGKNFLIQDNKFGNENLMTSDYRILIAQELTSANDYCGNNTPDLSTVDNSNYIGGFQIKDNMFNGVSGITVPLIYSMCMNVKDMYFDNLISGGLPTCMIDFPTEQSEWNRLNKNSFFRLRNGDEQSESLMPPISLKTGMGIISDPHGYMAGRLDVPQYFTGGTDNGFVELTPNKVTAGNVSGATKTNITDSLGDNNAIEIAGNGVAIPAYVSQSAVTPGRVTWVEFDVKQSTTLPCSTMKFQIVSNNNSTSFSFRRIINLANGWTRVRFLWIPRPISVGDYYTFQFSPNGYVAGTSERVQMGRLKIYHANEPVRDGLIRGHHLTMESGVTGIAAISGKVQLYYDGTNLKLMLSDGTTKTVTLT